jgi:hypothetical protein
MMISLPSHELPIHNFIALIPHEPVERLDDRLQINALGYSISAVLTLRTSVIVVGTFEDKAQTLGYEANIASFTPTQKIKSKLSEAVILTHIVHGTTPTVESIVQRLCTWGFDDATTDALQALKSRILRLTNGIIKVQLGGEVPFSVIGVLTTDVIRVQS